MPPPAASFVQFDMSINLTTILGVLVWMITLAIAWTKFGNRIDLLELRVQNVETAIASIAKTLESLNDNKTQLALIQQTLASVQKDHSTLHETVELMRRGEGFITGPRRGNIEGEWSRAGKT